MTAIMEFMENDVTVMAIAFDKQMTSESCSDQNAY